MIRKNKGKSYNLTPHWKVNRYDFGGMFENTTSQFIDSSDFSDFMSAKQGNASIGNSFKYTGKMIDAALPNAKLASTYNIQSNIADNMNLAISNNRYNTNDELMQGWDRYNPMSHVRWSEVRGGSTLGRLHNSQMSELRGAEAGWQASGGAWQGALIGGIVGKIGGNLAWTIGDRKASKIRKKLNREIDQANELGYQTLSNRTSDVAWKNLLRAEANIGAEGGDLNTSLNKKYAGDMMQQVYNNGIPANKFVGGGTTITATVSPSDLKNNLSILLPYIKKAKEMREAQRPLVLNPETGTATVAEKQEVKPIRVTMPERKQEARQSLNAPSKELINSIIGFEGFSARPYLDTNGKYTIGYGDQDADTVNYYLAHPDETIPVTKARQLLEKTVGKVYNFVSRNTENWDKLSDPQRDALVSYAYNVGIGSYKNSHPKLHKALKELDYKGIGDNISAGYYKKNMPGLRKRRDFERLPFYNPSMSIYGVMPNQVPDAYRRDVVDSIPEVDTEIWNNPSF